MSSAPEPSGVGLRRLVAPVVAVLAVVAIIGVLLFIGRHPVPAGHPAVVTAGSASNSSPAVATTPTPSSSPRTSSRATTPASAAAGTRTHRHQVRPARRNTPARHTAPNPEPPLVAPVTVLNNSRIQGLAHSAAAQIAERGWPIARVGNFTGRLAQTTLFYLPGQYDIAERLAAEFPGFAGVAEVEPRPAALPGSGLTLVLTRYWES